MSVERPQSVSRPVTWLARAATLALGAFAVALAATAPAGAAFLASPLSSALLVGATAVTGWFMTNKAVEARTYNEARLDAIKKAEKTGETPHLPKNPFLDPADQPHPLITKTARYLAGALLVVGILTPLALLGDVSSVGGISTLGESFSGLSFLPEAVKQAGPLAIATTLTLGGATLLKMAGVAESTRRFAEYEVSHHGKDGDDLELTHEQEMMNAPQHSTQHDFDTASHPANQPHRKSFVDALFAERGITQNTQQER